MPLNPPRRFYSLDVMRGCASLAVVVWHYQHFFFVAPGKTDPAFVRSAQPFHAVLSPFYERGDYAVQLFFVLSGFIFYWLYREPLSKREITSSTFTILRFSRLYPLHLLTLLYVLVGQWLYSGVNGHAFVYDNNDVKHFLLNLLLASEWGFQDGYSFNGPIWSVSIEIILYAAFFVLAASGRLSTLASLAIASIGALLAASGAKQLGTGVLCFFLGGATYLTYQRICLLVRSGRSASAVTAAVVLAASAGWVAGLQHLPSTAGKLLLFGAAFPLSVLALALLESAIPDLGKRYRRLGDLTYATYLLHFPIQLTIATAISHLGWKVNYNDPFIFLAYVCVVLLASVYTYFRFELVAQQLLRQRLLRD